jgi:hypothetical protein
VWPSASPWQAAKVDLALHEPPQPGQRSRPEWKPFRNGPIREGTKKLSEYGGISGQPKHGVVDHAGRLLAEKVRLNTVERLEQVDIRIHPRPQRSPLELVPKPIGKMAYASGVMPKDCGLPEDFGGVAHLNAGGHIRRSLVAIQGHAMALPKDGLQTCVLDGSKPLADPQGHAIRHEVGLWHQAC